MPTSKTLSQTEKNDLIKILKTRFEKNKNRHEGVKWIDVETKLNLNLIKLWSINEMEKMGGEPDVTSYDSKTNEYIFVDCVAESPKERRSLCYDREALESRKQFKPKNSAIDMANEMEIEILNEQQYQDLQKLGNFDTKTSSWLASTDEVRKLGGAIFGDFRFGRVFIYHNGAESYYAGRGFRGFVRI